ncbi:MAG TPA: MSMEG_0565 family glycosyltransferase [Pseudonocardiaceae bacterium]|nr:MSMEG_0565 family glycosyltransferase [Pseudonocardiaceae bacterium]
MTVALVTHSTKPRGGLVHTMGLAEGLHREGHPVYLIALGDPAVGLFRPTAVPHTVLPVPAKSGSLEERVFASIDVLTDGLARLVDDGSTTVRADILHAQDCIAARAAARVRDAGAPVSVVRTVHHVDDFTTPVLVTCQREAILEPDQVLVVSEQWRRILRADYGVEPVVVPNGVDLERFSRIPPASGAELRARIGITDERTFLFLAVGGVEPRKGSVYLFEALGRLRRELTTPVVLAIVGGHSFQDYAAYRDAALDSLPGLGLALGRDVVLLGTVDDAELAGWYQSADALAFPSVKEGWGLAVLEAMSQDLPVIATDLPVFREYLTDHVDALLPRVADAASLAGAMRELVTDSALRDRLRAGGRTLLPRFTWQASARRHLEVYAEVRRLARSGTTIRASRVRSEDVSGSS